MLEMFKVVPAGANVLNRGGGANCKSFRQQLNELRHQSSITSLSAEVVFSRLVEF